MSRENKFRGRDITTGEWLYGSLVNNLWVYSSHHSLAGKPVCEIISSGECDDYEDMQDKELNRTVHPDSVGQFTGLLDKNGKEVYEGDIVRWYTVEIEYQTHTGDNIPMGSYTEPCGTICRKYEKSVIFRDAMFTCAPPHDPEEEEYPNCDCPIHYAATYDRKELNNIFFPRPYGRENEVLSEGDFAEVAQSIAEELGFDCASNEDFIKKINGFEVIGNIHEHPELIK